MQNIKQSAIDLIRKMPENCSIEDIQYELYAKSKIEAGLEDINNGKTISEQDMDKEIDTWLQ